MSIKPFEKRIWLSSPTMHGEEQKYTDEAIKTNWVSTVGENINEVEKRIAAKIGRKFAAGLSCGTAALHMAVKLCGEKLYGRPAPGHGALEGKKVFCSDMTFAATVNPVVYEGGEPVFIDTEYETWNMNPAALSKAFELYPETRLVVLAHLYGTPAKIDGIVKICKEHGALLIEDAAESLGASYKGAQTGTFGDVSAISFNGNKIITGSSGGMLLTDLREDCEKVKKWSTQSREAAPWYQHEELGYNYRMSNIIAGVVRGQIPYLEEHIAQKKAIYERYKKGFSGLPLSMNPFDAEISEPNFWLSCAIIDKNALCRTETYALKTRYTKEKGKTCSAHILDALSAINAEGKPIWKPMHLQPIYCRAPFVAACGSGTEITDACVEKSVFYDVGADIFKRGLCLPSDNKMTPEEQSVIIEAIKECF